MSKRRWVNVLQLKRIHSIGLVDNDYKFIFNDVGCQGRVSDGGVFRNTETYNHLVSNELYFPDPMERPESQNPAWNVTCELISTPFVISGDEAFSLNKHLMKPYAGIFNDGLLRFCRCGEKVTKLALAIAVLHNFSLTKSGRSYSPKEFVNEEILETGEVIPGEWRLRLTVITPLKHQILKKLKLLLKLCEALSESTLFDQTN